MCSVYKINWPAVEKEAKGSTEESCTKKWESRSEGQEGVDGLPVDLTALKTKLRKRVSSGKGSEEQEG